MVVHPAPEFLAVATEVRGLVHARGETIERDEQVCGKLSHEESRPSYVRESESGFEYSYSDIPKKSEALPEAVKPCCS